MNDRNSILKIQREPETIDVVSLRGCRFIGIDGDQGSGKTTLANELRIALRGNVIELDEFLLKNAQPYLKQLQIEGVQRELSSNRERIQIIEGLMLLDVLEMLGVTADSLIFAKRVEEGTWKYGYYLQPNVNLPKAQTTREIAEYYRRKRPWNIARIQTTLFVSMERADGRKK